MDKKVAIIAVVVIAIIIAAAAALALTSNKSNERSYNLDDIKDAPQNASINGKAECYDKFEVSGCNLLIFGNVNNDMDINSDDVFILKNIINTGVWDKTKYPLADVNCDKKVNNDDLVALNKIINKEKTLLYYVNDNGYPEYIHYPITGNLGINYDYGYMAAQIIGIWDRVTAGTDRWVGDRVTDTLYPGVHELYNMGTEQTVEADLAAYQAAGVTVITGSRNLDVNNALHEAGWGIDYINVRLDQCKYIANVEPIDRFLTFSFMFDKLEKGKEFYNYWTGLDNKIQTIFDNAGIEEKTFVIPYNTNQAVETSVDDALAIGRTMGDYTNVASNLPLTAKLEPSTVATSPCYTTTIEYLFTQNPDVLIISLWGKLTNETSYSDAYAAFKEKADYYSKFDAYKNGDVYGVCYETFGTFAGVAVLYLLCSYIYPEYFSEADGWNYVNEYFHNYTLIDKNKDIKECGGLIVFKLGKTSP